MKKIYKYTLPKGYWSAVKLPFGFKILSFDIQRGDIVFWAEVEPEREKKDVEFYTVMTGDAVPEGRVRHCATLQLHNETFVLHVYQKL